MTNQISDASEDVINLVGKTNYGDLADLARNCKYSIGNDTGPMHLIAKVAKKKSKKIILFGQDSNPLLCAPRGEGVIIIKKDSITEISVNHVLKNLNLKLGKGDYVFAKTEDMLIAKTTTFMNHSGLSVKSIIDYFNLCFYFLL